MSNKDTLKHLFSETVKGIIWKIVLDDQNEILLLESRTEDKQTFFYGFDFKNQKPLFKELQLEEKWFISLEGIINGVAVFQGYENEFSPLKKGIIAYDTKLSKTLWQNYAYTCERITASGIIAYNSKIQPKKTELLETETGLLLKSISLEDLPAYPIPSNSIYNPSIIFGENIQETRHQLILGNLQVIASYEREEESLNQYLEVYQNEEIIFRDKIQSDIQKITPDTFFIWKGKLVYIRNKSEIVSYLL